MVVPASGGAMTMVVLILMATNVCTLCLLVWVIRCKHEAADGGAAPANGGGGAEAAYGDGPAYSGGGEPANSGGDKKLFMYTTESGKKLHSTPDCKKSGMCGSMTGLKSWEFCAHCADPYRRFGLDKRKYE